MKKFNIKIIAEIGVNHDGSLSKAKKLILAAKNSGADYVKFQAFEPDELCVLNSKKADYQKKNSKNETQLQMLKKLSLSKSQMLSLKHFSRKKKIKIMFSVFDNKSLNFVNKLNLEYIKLPSGEINNLKLINELNLSKSNIIFSSGASNLNDIQNCLTNLNKRKKLENIILMHCNSEYPTPLNDLNLNVIKTLKKKFKINIGFSDHSRSTLTPAIAVAAGASMIEKHLTLNQKSIGPDHNASLNPIEFKTMVKFVREAEVSLGSFDKVVTKSEKKNQNIIRKSIVAKNNISIGEKFNESNITTKRPGHGLSPFMWNKILKKKAKRNYKRDDLIINE
tara:strand:- start:12 stop:1019 length:1008 start_codon:yes stop_codon:yes gene_type:complete